MRVMPPPDWPAAVVLQRSIVSVTVIAVVHPSRAIARPHPAPAAVVIAGVEIRRANEREATMMKAVVEVVPESGMRETRTRKTGANKARATADKARATADKARTAGKAHAAAHGVHATTAHRAHAATAMPSKATAVPAARERGRREGNRRAEHGGHQANQDPSIHPSLHLKLRRSIPLQEHEGQKSEIIRRFQMTKVTDFVHVYEQEVS
jgi:hypothetical protein